MLKLLWPRRSREKNIPDNFWKMAVWQFTTVSKADRYKSKGEVLIASTTEYELQLCTKEITITGHWFVNLKRNRDDLHVPLLYF